MIFAIGSVHRAGSNYLASVLDDVCDGVRVWGENHTDIPVIADGIVNKIHSGDYDSDKLKKAYAESLNDLLLWLEIEGMPVGQVSPQYTYVLDDIKADKKAFLIRDPYYHLLSKINFHNPWGTKMFDRLVKDLDLFYGYIVENPHIKKFKYEHLRSGGIKEIADWLGLECDWSKADFDTVVNPSKTKKFQTLERALGTRYKEVEPKIKYYRDKLGY